MGEELRAKGHQVEVLQRRPGFDFRCSRRFARFCRKQRVTLIHAQQYGPFFYSALGRLVSRDIPILYTEHGLGYPHWNYPKRKRILANRLLLRRRDRVLAVGNTVRESVVANLGIPPDRVEVVYNGVNLEQYHKDPASRAEARADLGFQDDHVVVVQVARLEPVKDHLTAIRAIARLAGSRPKLRLVLVGDGPERPRIEALIAELGLQRQVRLLGMRRDVPRLLSAGDVFLLSSISEGVPLTLIEAMACGLPCASTRVGDIPEIVVHGETGLLAEPASPESLSACLQQLAGDAGSRRKMGMAGLKLARQRFAEQTMHAAYAKIYREMLGV